MVFYIEITCPIRIEQLNIQIAFNKKTKPNILTTSNSSKKRPLKLCKCFQLWYGVKRSTN